MPTYMIKLKPTATDDDIKAVKDKAVSNGGTITHEYKLIKGFAVEMPEQVTSMSFVEEHPHVEHVELDQTIKI
ncbi:uncharacterized protein DSM5745_00671 [Aspergillus mulundensis]|uniref:Inhibitor I9 domain-containing protein n=1 Tax=Aspergillus mulundensis TaxID=1810919 RepID=A0A3D8T499_9EURO|nr:Uncharacterized protein DSM5745_00671 [Aspergillus mulundensis]RDW93349.1 Uncharacterized protein DSM5745_00671 [Aspergillus mulundensis]